MFLYFTRYLLYSGNINFGTKFIIALCDVFGKSLEQVDFILKNAIL
jgi:hypothetical protein